VNGIDIVATKTKIDAFKENKDLIQRNKKRATLESQELEEQLEKEESDMKKKRVANEKLVDLLMFSDDSTEDIVASHKQSVAAQEQYVLFIPCFLLIYVSTTS